MNLIFVHGWGFGPDIWGPLLDRIDYSIKVQCVDLGYFRDEACFPEISEDSIGVGHSLGVLWLLRNSCPSMKKFVSVAGFDQFVPHINPRLVKAMKVGLSRNVEKQLQSFWNNCDAADYTHQGSPNATALTDGLDALLEWDEREALASFSGPKLVLGSKDDKITPYQMQCDIWGEKNVIWSETGGHMLPLTRPDWVAKHITDFIYD